MIVIIIIIIIIIITIIISLITLVIIIIIIIIAPKVFSYNAGDCWGGLYGRPICRAFREKFFLIWR